MAKLTDLGDDDFHLDFSAVFRRGLYDVDAEVRRLSIDGLWEHEHVTLVRPFLRLLEDESPEVQASAASALGRFVLQGELGQLTMERFQEIVSRLLALTDDVAVPTAVRRRAIESLAYSSDPELRGIIARAYEDPDDRMRQSAIFAMGRSADEYWRGQVRAELSSDEAAFRFEAARAAGELADPKAVASLARLLADEEIGVREVAIWSLGQIGGAQARRALQIFIEQDESELAEQARDALAEMALLEGDLTTPFLGDSLFEGEDDDDDA